MEDPVVVDNTSMTEVERRLSIQLFNVLALICRGKVLQVIRRVPEGFGFEAWKQLCREFEPRLPSRSQRMLQDFLSPTKMDDPVQTIYQWESRVKVYEEQSGDKVSDSPLERAVSTPDDERYGSQGSDQLLPSKADVDGVWNFGSHGLVAARQGRRRQEGQMQGQK